MTATQLTNTPTGEWLTESIQQASQELASVQAGCDIHSLFRPSYTNAATGLHGVRWLIVNILENAGAVHPEYNGQFRNLYLKTGLTTSEITAKVRECNGFNKYHDKTILDNLTTVLANEVGNIQMTSAEDYTRSCKKPRCRWYLIAKAN